MRITGVEGITTGCIIMDIYYTNRGMEPARLARVDGA